MLEIQITANNDITIGEKLISLGGVMRVYSMFQNFQHTYMRLLFGEKYNIML